MCERNDIREIKEWREEMEREKEAKRSCGLMACKWLPADVEVGYEPIIGVHRVWRRRGWVGKAKVGGCRQVGWRGVCGVGGQGVTPGSVFR